MQGILGCVFSFSLTFSLCWGSWKVLSGILLAEKAARITQPSLMPEALGAGLALPSSPPRADTGLGLSDWIQDSRCPVSPKSKARGKAGWLHPEPG